MQRRQMMLSFVLLVVGSSCLVNAQYEGCIHFKFWTFLDKVLKNPYVIDVTRRGYLASPGYVDGKGYPDNMLCYFQLRAPTGKHIRLKFTDVDIALSAGCEKHGLQVHDATELGEAKGLYCGKVRPNDIVSTHSVIQIIFKAEKSDTARGFNLSHDSDTARGFNLSYSLQDTSDLCHPTQIQCMNRKCVSNSKVCDGNDDCEDGTDEEDCSIPDLVVKECGRREVYEVLYQEPFEGCKNAPENSWPWMADLQMGIALPNGHFCGGSLINAQWVVTAASCFNWTLISPSPEKVRVHLGKHHKYLNDTYEQIRYGERIVIYDDEFEKGGRFDRNNDVALIKLNAPVQFTRGVKPICLPSKDIESDILNPHVVCFHAGWGAKTGASYADVLKQGYRRVLEESLCTQCKYTRDDFNGTTMICTDLVNDMDGACHDDRGGPLACKINKEWHLFGVSIYVNYKFYCDDENHAPSVFMKIANKTEWIRRMVQKYS